MPPGSCRCTRARRRPCTDTCTTPLAKPGPATALLISPAGTRLLYGNVQWTFQKLLRHNGIQPRSRTCRPRIHDLRHTFAVTALLDAYRDGLDIDRRLTLLATYLGHISPAGTYWYLSATPQLLAAALDRLDRNRSELQ